jgi:ribosome-binding protein aMBF1 (putative translation factor)
MNETNIEELVQDAIGGLRIYTAKERTGARDLAKFLGLNFTLVYKWASGTRAPTPASVEVMKKLQKIWLAWKAIDDVQRETVRNIQAEFGLRKHDAVSGMINALRKSQRKS